MATYEIHVTSKDHLGLNFIENIISLAAKGAVQKEGTYPRMKFPHSIKMILESDVEPVADAYHRVFNLEDLQELNPGKVTQSDTSPVSSGFSMDTNHIESLSVDELGALSWDDFKIECKKKDVKGRDRNLMTKQYLSK